MAKKTIYTEDTLAKMGLVKDEKGNYYRPKSVPQPRDLRRDMKEQGLSDAVVNRFLDKYEKDNLEDIKPREEYQTISLILMGEPMSKQSVRATKAGHFFQPKKYIEREKDYKNQIAKQLPKGFIPFSEEVQITKMHIIYAPLKAFQKQKGMMERIRNGELIKKTTKPDLPDNCKKLVLDAMSGLVYKDDALIWAEDNVRKYYSTGGCIIIELIGK